MTGPCCFLLGLRTNYSNQSQDVGPERGATCGGSGVDPCMAPFFCSRIPPCSDATTEVKPAAVSYLKLHKVVKTHNVIKDGSQSAGRTPALRPPTPISQSSPASCLTCAQVTIQSIRGVTVVITPPPQRAQLLWKLWASSPDLQHRCWRRLRVYF